MAEKWRSRLLLLHVVPMPNYPPMLMGTYFNVAEFEASLRADAEARVKEFAGKTRGRTVQVDKEVIMGETFGDSCPIAEQEQVDLIIMGSHGRPGLGQVKLRSIAERVVRHAPCPV